MLYLLIFTFISLTNQSKFYVNEKQTGLELKNDYLEFFVSKVDNKMSLSIKKNLHLQRFSLNIFENYLWGVSKKTEISAQNRYPNYGEVYFKIDYLERFVNYKFRIDSISLYCEINVIPKSENAKEVELKFSLSTLQQFDYLFIPCSNIPISIKDLRKKTIKYRQEMFIPIVSLCNSSEDYGLSIIGPFDIPKPTLSFSIDRESLVVSFNHLGLTKKKKIKAAIYVVPHGGDWREGLNFLLNKYPEYFYPKVENTKIGEGWYYLASSFGDENGITAIHNRGVKWIELHMHFPFYGLYTPQKTDWGLIFDSDEINLSEWQAKVGIGRNSYEKMHKVINLWHKYGIQVYLYFQAFEAWHQYAAKYFANDIAKDKNDNNLPAWQFCNLMNPEPGSKWGKHIIQQAKKVIKEYPKIDGVFYDRMDYWNYDFAHDDGITMIDGNPAYMLSFALEKMNEKIFDIFHKKGKAIWGNGPTSIEVCKNLDGIMAEGSLHNLYKLQYLSLVRPLIYLPYDKKPEETEEKLKHSLVCGAFPSITYGGAECQKLDEKYRPLFELIKGRKWVLTSNPIEVSKRFKANIFQTPDSNYVAVIINPEKSQLIPHPFEYNIPVTISLPDVQEIKNVYLLSGDWTGVVALSFKRDDNKINISVPIHLSSSVVYLSKNEKFKNALTTVPVLIREPVSFAPIEDIFIQSINGDSVKFYFTNNTNQKLTFQLQAVFIKGDGWAKLPKKIILNDYETKIIPLIIGTKSNSEIKLKVLFNDRAIEKIFSVKTGLVHEDEDLFYDDFREGMKKWTIVNGAWKTSNGIAQASGPSHFAYIKRDWPDYVVQAKARCLGSDDPRVDWLKSYIFFRLKDEKNFYRFGIHGDAGVIDLYKCVNGEWILLASSQFEPKTGKWYTLRIDIKGTKITGYLNGEEVLQISDSTFSSGGIGIGVLEDGMRCEYWDITVK